jgi:polyisoprenoid-binding protein YceI
MHSPTSSLRWLSRASLVSVAALFTTGCGASATEVRYVSAVPAKVEQKGAVERYELRPHEARVSADVSAGSSYALNFGRVRGTFVLSPTVPEASTAELSVDITSATASWQLVADVAMSDFLHAQQHPEAIFTTRSIRRAPEGGLEVFADFTLHGVKKTVIVPAAIQVDPCRAKLTCEFEIERSVFGTVDDGSYESFVSDDVVIRIAIDVARLDAPQTCAKDKRPAGNVAGTPAVR